MLQALATTPAPAPARRSGSLPATTLLSQTLLLVLPAQLATLLAPGLVLATFVAPGLVLAQLHLLGQLSLAFPPELPALSTTCELPCLLFLPALYTPVILADTTCEQKWLRSCW